MSMQRHMHSIFDTKSGIFRQKRQKSWKRLENIVPLHCQNEGG